MQVYPPYIKNNLNVLFVKLLPTSGIIPGTKYLLEAGPDRASQKMMS